ncbi:Crp/Fnr family transcriptional regulator [Bradymonas sediminis]|uniref:Uncharacterized protein n=1 Tax=Bradymonas sediminis TaxID=1548548 RepID=A0A2Z4FP17_9DELT|nr:cyclic nucleotide-binding domain-containing protein [Bradymonas sediminis]AWV90620.1 hypothetical protein DN745_15330 [Bradymonas sediminis]TDP62380.1 CRP-like cAMP-binding protein [Bradymonas sediminis]
MGNSEQVIFDKIGESAFFARLQADDARALVAACEPLTVLPGQAIWSPGEAKDAAYILVSGRVQINYRVQPDGHREDQYAAPGTFLTLSSLVHSWRHASAGIALERSQLLRLTRPEFEELFEAGHPAAFALVDLIADDLVAEVRDANRRLHEVFGHPAETLRMLRRRSRVGRR